MITIDKTGDKEIKVSVKDGKPEVLYGFDKDEIVFYIGWDKLLEVLKKVDIEMEKIRKGGLKYVVK